jgi:hypothetical protein
MHRGEPQIDRHYFHQRRRFNRVDKLNIVEPGQIVGLRQFVFFEHARDCKHGA